MSPPHRSSFLPTNGAASIFLSTSPMPGWRSCPTSPATSNPSVPARSCRRSSRSRCPAVTLKRRWGCCNVCNCPSSSSRTLNTNQEFVCVNGAVFPPVFRLSSSPKRRWKRPTSPSRPWSASSGPAWWAPWSGTRRKSWWPNKPSNTWRYEAHRDFWRVWK